MVFRTAAVAFLLATLIFPRPGAAGSGSYGSKRTHLAVAPNRVVNLRTYGIPNDNTGGHQFYYDRYDTSPFSVPEGYSFVVTDLFILPDVGTLTTSQQMFVAVSFGSGRNFYAHYLSAEIRHFALAGGFVIAGGATPTARNITDSTHSCDVQMLGYFVKAEALADGESPFPAPEL
jgi:hypothetical protein